MERSLTVEILARQRADTIEAISHTAEWSASVAMVLQQLGDSSVQQDFVEGKIVTGTNTGEVLVSLAALSDLFNPVWSASVVDRRVRAQARGLHMGRLLIESSEELKFPSQYGVQTARSYAWWAKMLSGLVNSSYWDDRVSNGSSSSLTAHHTKLKPEAGGRMRKKGMCKEKRVNPCKVPGKTAVVALAQTLPCVDSPMVAVVKGEHHGQQVSKRLFDIQRRDS